MASKENGNLIAGALFLLAGGIVGAGVALLFAPQSGDKTRKDICRLGRKARRKTEDAVEVVEDFADNLSEIVDEVGERAAEILDKGKDMALGAKKKLLKALEESGEQLEKQRSKLSKLVG